MKSVMVSYRVKPDRAADNEELIRAVYEELHRIQPPGLRYATFRLADGVTFVHLAVEEASNESGRLTDIDAFRRFQQNIDERLDEQPTVSALHEIGSFRLHSSD